MEPDYTADVRRLVEQLAPATSLCVGPDCETVFGRRPGLVKLAAGTGLLERLAPLPRFDFAFLSRTIEYLERREAMALLAHLRDCLGGRFSVLVPVGEWPGHVSHWQDQELLALGLVRKAIYPRDHGELRLYAYDIAEYKTTPEWFNADYWAHPERWDKDWW